MAVATFIFYTLSCSGILKGELVHCKRSYKF